MNEVISTKDTCISYLRSPITTTVDMTLTMNL
jgi:hypothetical protein